MNYSELELSLKKLIVLGDGEYSEYVKQMVDYVEKKVNRECSEYLFTYYDKEDFKEDIYIKVHKLLRSIEYKSFTQILCYSKTAVDNFIKNKKRNLNLRLHRRVDKSMYKSYSLEKYRDKIAIKARYIDTLEEHVDCNPIPNSVVNKLTKVEKDILKFILRNGDISARSYANYKRINERTAEKRIERFRKHICNEMILWQIDNQEEASLISEVFLYIKTNN